MAEVHIERLRRLVVCPVCRQERQEITVTDLGEYYMKRFNCGALFAASLDKSNIYAIDGCGQGTVVAARLMTAECVGAVS
jgi:hypothetical protein